ncbi:MAG TPA: hypothetical protein DCM41_00850 [Synergistaceae bacterium]|nr:hypothetical protein [Synergistaceae bacterium]
MAYPEWVLKHKAKGTQINCVNGHYYLYEVSSVWNKEKGRAQKITKAYLGTITEEGLIPPGTTRDLKLSNAASLNHKEFGASQYLQDISGDIIASLKDQFPDVWQQIITVSFLRTMYRAPFKRMEHYYTHSFVSEFYQKQQMSGKSISALLRDLGARRENICAFMRKFVGQSSHLFFDATSIFSESGEMDINRIGYNSKRIFTPQISLLYAFAKDKGEPAYYRILPGKIRDVSAFGIAVKESGINNAVVVADKGFGSEKNFTILEGSGVEYIIPLRRSSSFFDRSVIKTGDKSSFDGRFIFRDRLVCYYSRSVGNGRTVHTFVDEDLRSREACDYQKSIDADIEGYTPEGFLQKQYDFGTIVMLSNMTIGAKEIYDTYKQRADIEQSFDMLKDLLGQDSSYMQDEDAPEAWAFINHISLMLCYRLFRVIKDHGLTSKYSVEDLIEYLKSITKIKINGGEWITAKVSSKTAKLLKACDIHIT